MNDVDLTLSQKHLVLVFAYAPTGLGHLRVTEALYRGLAPEVNSILLRAQDSQGEFWHYVTSIMPGGPAFLEWSQKGLPELLFTKVYRFLLRSQTKTLYQQMSTILDERIELPKTVLVVATHFGLAHQLAQIKEALELDKWVKIILVVQVTDDTDQHIWYVPGADMIFVPSEKTKKALESYGKIHNLPPVRFEVLPYPITPALAEKLTAEQMQNKLAQLDKDSKSMIETAIPISGAAVGMDFSLILMDELHKLSARFRFCIISRYASYTQPFLAKLTERQFAELEVSPSTREIVDKYEDVYERKVISLEMTKPSEQAFKALFNPNQRGGSILLFAKPVGKQEYDNLDFLRRHGLIPLESEQKALWQKAARGLPSDGLGGEEVVQKAAHWRGIIIPHQPKHAAQFIWWCLNEGLFTAMAGSFIEARDYNHTDELGSDGVQKFWKKIAQLVKEVG
ncbi:hypothetical protein M1563_04550 [Patescibacteria group bacterium]|nr:hypothetical protein [Patescibacteria group bacterium]